MGIHPILYYHVVYPCNKGVLHFLAVWIHSPDISPLPCSRTMFFSFPTFSSKVFFYFYKRISQLVKVALSCLSERMPFSFYYSFEERSYTAPLRS